ncbi:TetR/AcrR family transcriptional regulator [Paracoccus siganidrum]|uniref:TetR/AcrR family transcriptional regulator n=1 Tax=Paracoccus siganidrum TaxID=1276757 RepID=A0A419A5H9_9RHOB|nr:TetR/AcrR family transcriptional regulator [Paracoccus siganidrum]RJL11891.1 TetR/AcrR family transcriptional regulator [Paracoccus siganidrum]RMC35897.1 TetR/AcrR family transcriptional regulator [Paracoccus siganidrum]
MARPRQYDHDALRASTIEAARRLLEEGGPTALTARALAQAVRTTPGTIYNLFSGMNEVLLEVNRQGFIELAQAVDSIRPGDPRDWLIAMADTYVDFMVQRPVVWRGLFEGPRVTEEFPRWYIGLIDALIDRVAGPIAALQPKTSPRQLAEELLISVHGVVALAASSRLDLLTHQEPHELAHRMIDRMIAAIGSGVA